MPHKKLNILSAKFQMQDLDEDHHKNLCLHRQNKTKLKTPNPTFQTPQAMMMLMPGMLA